LGSHMIQLGIKEPWNIPKGLKGCPIVTMLPP
jgi:hypothetical protein